jgi:lipoprotein-releasing system ATP-binding protein
VTHDPRLAQRCDRIIELVDGRLVADRPNLSVVRRSGAVFSESLQPTS